jgi:hypothetical protein
MIEGRAKRDQETLMASMQLKDATITQLQIFAARESQALQQLWGSMYSRRVRAVDALLADPRARYFLADRRVVIALSQMLEGSGATP